MLRPSRQRPPPSVTPTPQATAAVPANAMAHACGPPPISHLHAPSVTQCWQAAPAPSYASRTCRCTNSSRPSDVPKSLFRCRSLDATRRPHSPCHCARSPCQPTHPTPGWDRYTAQGSSGWLSCELAHSSSLWGGGIGLPTTTARPPRGPVSHKSTHSPCTAIQACAGLAPQTKAWGYGHARVYPQGSNSLA